jgi:hypothetical protein
MKNLYNARFQKGSGAFRCQCCKRMTRDVIGNAMSDLCPECYEMGGIENEIADRGDPDGSLMREVQALRSTIRQKGGVL